MHKNKIHTHTHTQTHVYIHINTDKRTHYNMSLNTYIPPSLLELVEEDFDVFVVVVVVTDLREVIRFSLDIFMTVPPISFVVCTAPLIFFSQ